MEEYKSECTWICFMQIRLMTTYEHLQYKKSDVAALNFFSVNYLIALKTAAYVTNKFKERLSRDIVSR